MFSSVIYRFVLVLLINHVWLYVHLYTVALKVDVLKVFAVQDTSLDVN